MITDNAGKQINPGDYFVCSRKSGNCNSLSYGKVIEVFPKLRVLSYWGTKTIIRNHDSILVIPLDLVPQNALTHIDNPRS